MTNSAKTALQKIIEAFGTTPKTLTRIQIFAKIARMSNDIEEKRLYADISEVERTQVLEDLKKYFLLYKAEEYLIHQPLFYPRALLYWALRKVDPTELTRQKNQLNTNSFIKEASRVGGYTDVFENCLRELEQNPNDYPSRSMHELMDDLSAASHIDVPLLRAHFRAVTGYTRNETRALLNNLSRFSHANDAEQVNSAIHKKYSPSVGPDTPEELYFTMGILFDYANNLMMPKTFSSQEMMASFRNLAGLSRSICRDIPQKNLDDQFKIFPITPLYFMAKANIDYSESISHALAMGRYFIERHRDKLDLQNAIYFREALADLYIKLFFHDEVTKSKFGGQTSSDEHIEGLIQRMLHETWAEWEKPSVDEMIASFDGLLKGKNKLNFHTLLEQAEPYFDVHVSYYVEQNEVIRKLRRNLFKSGSINEDNDGHRAKFLKKLADEHSDQLTIAGFSDEEIRFIERTGKLLQRNAPQYNWNVDHVVDIHAGGTNNPENLCLMPASLNQMKNTFLLLQTGLYREENRGFWVLTLRPKLGPDGKTAPILMERLKHTTTPLAPENNGPL
jgi:hypothetical protein